MTIQFRAETVVSDSGVKVESATVIFEGASFTATGSILDHEKGVVVGYPVKNTGGFELQSFSGEKIGSARLVNTWKQSCFGAWPVEVHAWECVVDGYTYHGRNSGPSMLLRLRRSRRK